MPLQRRHSLSQPPERFKVVVQQQAQWRIDLAEGVAKEKEPHGEVPLRTLRLTGLGSGLCRAGSFKVPVGRPLQLFDAELDMDGKQPLGAVLRRWSPNSLVVLRLLPHSALSAWNYVHPQLQVRVGDLINKVTLNDRPVLPKDTLSVLGRLCKGKMTLGIGRKGGDGEAYFTLSVQKHTKFPRLGLELTIQDEELLIHAVVKDGPVWRWNEHGYEQVAAPGDAVVAVNDRTGSAVELLDALDNAKMSMTLTLRKPLKRDWVKGETPSWTLELASAPKTAELIEEKERELLGANGSYVERAEAYDINGRETYWSRDGQYYLFFNSFREWAVGRAANFEANRDSPDAGRRFALAVEASHRPEVWDTSPGQDWLQWDILKGQWLRPGERTCVVETGATGPDELMLHVTVLLPGGREQTVHVPSLANLGAVAREVQKRLKVAEGKELRFRQRGLELEMGARVLRVNMSAPLQAGIFAVKEARRPERARSSSPRSRRGREVQQHLPEQWLKIPCDALFVDSTHIWH